MWTPTSFQTSTTSSTVRSFPTLNRPQTSSTWQPSRPSSSVGQSTFSSSKPSSSTSSQWPTFSSTSSSMGASSTRPLFQSTSSSFQSSLRPPVQPVRNVPDDPKVLQWRKDLEEAIDAQNLSKVYNIVEEMQKSNASLPPDLQTIANQMKQFKPKDIFARPTPSAKQAHTYQDKKTKTAQSEWNAWIKAAEQKARDDVDNNPDLSEDEKKQTRDRMSLNLPPEIKDRPFSTVDTAVHNIIRRTAPPTDEQVAQKVKMVQDNKADPAHEFGIVRSLWDKLAKSDALGWAKYFLIDHIYIMYMLTVLIKILLVVYCALYYSGGGIVEAFSNLVLSGAGFPAWAKPVLAGLGSLCMAGTGYYIIMLIVAMGPWGAYLIPGFLATALSPFSPVASMVAWVIKTMWKYVGQIAFLQNLWYLTWDMITLMQGASTFCASKFNEFLLHGAMPIAYKAIKTILQLICYSVQYAMGNPTATGTCDAWIEALFANATKSQFIARTGLTFAFLGGVSPECYEVPADPKTNTPGGLMCPAQQSGPFQTCSRVPSLTDPNLPVHECTTALPLSGELAGGWGTCVLNDPTNPSLGSICTGKAFAAPPESILVGSAFQPMFDILFQQFPNLKDYFMNTDWYKAFFGTTQTQANVTVVEPEYGPELPPNFGSAQTSATAQSPTPVPPAQTTSNTAPTATGPAVPPFAQPTVTGPAVPKFTPNTSYHWLKTPKKSKRRSHRHRR